MSALRFAGEHGPVALVPSAITAVTLEGDAVWIQDIHGAWWRCINRTYDDIASDLEFMLRRNAR